MQVLLANACPSGSATSSFYIIVFIELCKYILIEVAENVYYYYYYYVKVIIFLLLQIIPLIVIKISIMSLSQDLWIES